MMTIYNREELKERASKMTMEQLEEAEFFTEMIDRWSEREYVWISIIREEMRKRA